MSDEVLGPGKTEFRRLEQYRDRWSSYDDESGLAEISDKPSVEELKAIELFSDFDDRFLEKISPDISIARWANGSVLFEEGTYIDLAFYVLEGEVEVFVQGVGPEATGARPIFDLSRTVIGASPAESPTDTVAGGTVLMRRATRVDPSRITLLATMDFDLPEGAAARLGKGELIGEIGSMSGWPQSVTARTAGECRLVQIKVAALRLMKRKSKALKAELDELYRERSLAVQLKNTPLFQGCTDVFVDALKENVELVSCEPEEEIVKAGEAADCLYLVRSGFVKLMQGYADGEIAVSYLSKGMTLGEVEFVVEALDEWQSTALSVEYAELIKIPRTVVEQLIQSQPEIEDQLWQSATDRIREAGFSRRNVGFAEFTEVALRSGLVQGNSILAIDLNTCTRCDDCVRACADTHGGRPRFVREGNKYGNLLVAKSCYHCRDPVCLVGCPTGAIHRAGVGEVVAVDEDVCIGCSNCANNCPYDAIVMHETATVWPDDMVPTGLRGRNRAVASKCDLCEDTGHGPACVSNCPQGCAFRIGSLDEFQLLLTGDA
ncbi:MAG: cyclic nucleotide-binding domain-containing protein [Thermoanaerobaculia bacterium]